EWLLRGGQFRVSRPRLASCNACRGGGCATCRYQGAFSLPPDVEAPQISLPAQPEAGVVTLRLPHLGVQPETDTAAGHWILEVHPGAECSPGVVVSEPVVARGSWLWKIVVMSLVLALFWAWINLA